MSSISSGKSVASIAQIFKPLAIMVDSGDIANRRGGAEGNIGESPADQTR